MFFGNYDSKHYEQFQNVPKASRPYLLDQFMETISPHGGSQLHVAILVKRNKILAAATNKISSRSAGASSRGSQTYIHAEKNAVRSLGDMSRMRGADMYVMRIGKCSFMYSQPCPECTTLLLKCMKKYGLRNVYFTS